MANPQLQDWSVPGAKLQGYEVDGVKKVVAPADVERFELIADDDAKLEAVRAYEHPMNADPVEAANRETPARSESTENERLVNPE